MMKFVFHAGAAFGAMAIAPAAMAGGLAPAPSEPVIAAPAPAPVVLQMPNRFTGGYVGASIGWAFEGDDVVGIHEEVGGDFVDDYGNLESDGFIGGVHAGYRYAYNNWVFGGEIGIDGSDVGATQSVGGVDSSTSLNYLVTARAQLGVVAQPNLLIYGTGGVAHGEIDYSVTGTADGTAVDINDTTSRTGYTIGAGVEYAWDDNWSVRGEYNYTNLNKYRLTDDTGVTTSVTPEFHSVRVGVNFSF